MRSLFVLQQFGLVGLYIIFTLSLARSAASAQGFSPPIVNPTTVTSPSGKYTLSIDPSHRYGVGAATYQFKHNGSVVWEGTRPFTLYEARVTNDGTVGGYAYSHGLYGKNPGDWNHGGDLDVVILTPTGRTRLLQKTKRRMYGGQETSSAYPVVEGLTVDAVRDQLIVSVWGPDMPDEFRWRYQLSTGRVLPPKLVKNGQMMRFLHRSSALPPPKPIPFDAPVLDLALRDRIDLQASAAEAGATLNTKLETIFHEVAVRPDGWILVIDSGAGAVKMFDPKGRWYAARASVQLAKDADRLLFFEVRQIELGPEGAFSLHNEQFDSDGNSHGIVNDFQTPYERASTIKRRPDNTWMGSLRIWHVAAAPDGALAVVNNGLLLYSAQNRPERMIPLPGSPYRWDALTYDGKQIVLTDNKRLLCYGRNGKPRWQLLLPHLPGKQRWVPFLTEEGHTLCLFDGQHTLFRYAMP